MTQICFSTSEVFKTYSPLNFGVVNLQQRMIRHLMINLCSDFV